MTKDDLIKRLDELNTAINEHIVAHNKMAQERDAAISESMASHNMMIGQRNEVSMLINKFDNAE